MSEISLILVSQKKTDKNSEWHGKSTNKIRETHSFWRNIFDYGAIWRSSGSNHRFHLGIEVHTVWLINTVILLSGYFVKWPNDKTTKQQDNMIIFIHWYLRWFCLPDNRLACVCNPETPSRVTLASLGTVFQTGLAYSLS